MSASGNTVDARRFIRLWFFTFTHMEAIYQLINDVSQLDLLSLATTSGASFALIAAAEIGDKSQLVCMTLASRHRAAPVLWGAIAAFALLNTLAVVFGVAIANWLPDYLVAAGVALLFGAFGLHALFQNDDDDDDGEVIEKTGHGIFFTTFFLITVAEFGDKTQLAVVAFSSTASAFAVWLGSTLALAFTSALGVLAGRTVLQRIPLSLLHKISGVIFLLLAVLAAYRAYELMPVVDVFSYFKSLI